MERKRMEKERKSWTRSLGLFKVLFYFFQEYFNTLQLACEKGRKFYGWVNWTVAENTPNDLYYQSYNEYGMGWKIRVLDPGEEPSSVDKNVQNNAFIVSILTICLFAYFFS